MKNIAGPVLTAIFSLSCASTALAQNPNPLASLVVDADKHFIQCPSSTSTPTGEDSLVVQISIPGEGVYYICSSLSDLSQSWPEGKYIDFKSLLPAEKSAVNNILEDGGQSDVIPVVTTKQ